MVFEIKNTHGKVLPNFWSDHNLSIGLRPRYVVIVKYNSVKEEKFVVLNLKTVFLFRCETIAC